MNPGHLLTEAALSSCVCCPLANQCGKKSSFIEGSKCCKVEMKPAAKNL